MINFENDYNVGAHPNVLNKLIETNLIEQVGYGYDEYSQEAKKLIKKQLGNENVEIFFLSGGTQTNLIGLSSLLKNYEAVISATTGHIFVHETGSIEATGHKVIPVNTIEGKLTPDNIQKVLDDHKLEPHMVKPKIVYISNATELGTIYKKNELQDLSKFCKNNNLLLYMDGARLGVALTSDKNDLTLKDITNLVDVFYIGGTKNGALLGEAIIFTHPDLAECFPFEIKQKGGMLAKGRVLAIQFLELFNNNLFFKLSKHSNSMALKIIRAIKNCGYNFLAEPEANLIFPILPNKLIEKLKEKFLFSIIEYYDNEYTAIRLVTCWTSQEEKINQLIEEITTFKN